MPDEIHIQLDGVKYRTCKRCGASILTDPEITRMTIDGWKTHEAWHKSLDERIDHAASVGQYGDMVMRPLG